MFIVAAGGAGGVSYLVAWFKAEKYNSLALLDADDKGREIARKIEAVAEIDVNTEVLKLDEISEEFKGKSLEIEDLFNEEFYHIAVNRAYKEIFENKLGRSEVKLEEVPDKRLRTKRYSKFFRDKNLGGFDKVKVALEIKKMLLEGMSKEEEEMLEETVRNFEKIKEKFEKKGIKL